MGPSETQLIRAFDQAPEAIKESLTEGAAVDFMVSLTDRYDLHMDTAGYISGFIRNMLLGFIRPEEFMGKLKSVGLSDETARQLTTDLNKEIFIPLRDSVRGSAGTSSRGEIPHVPVMSVFPPKPVKIVVPEEKTNAPVQPSYNLISETPLSSAAPVKEVTVPQQPVVSPTIRTMQHDMDLIQHGSLPAPYPATVSMPHPSQSTPARMFQTASVPVTTTQRPEPIHILPDVKQQAPQAAPQILPSREVSSDPYREPI